MSLWSKWLTHHPFKVKIAGPSPVRDTKIKLSLSVTVAQNTLNVLAKVQILQGQPRLKVVGLDS